MSQYNHFGESCSAAPGKANTWPKVEELLKRMCRSVGRDGGAPEPRTGYHPDSHQAWMLTPKVMKMKTLQIWMNFKNVE